MALSARARCLSAVESRAPGSNDFYALIVLDVGCGWGSLSLYAAGEYGASVVGVTISQQQKDFVEARVAERGLGDRVEVRLQDYRDVADGPFDTMLVQQMSRTTRPGGGPFIEAFIAPDMHMRPVGQTVALIEQAGFEVRDVHALREHYVRTVDAWYATFEEERMGVDQILAVKPSADGTSELSPVRTW